MGVVVRVERVVARQQRGDDDVLVGARAERRREQQRERERQPVESHRDASRASRVPKAARRRLASRATTRGNTLGVYFARLARRRTPVARSNHTP